MKHVELVVKYSAVWGSSMGGAFFSHIGHLVLDILHILSCADDKDDLLETSLRPQTLLIVSQQSLWSGNVKTERTRRAWGNSDEEAERFRIKAEIEKRKTLKAVALVELLEKVKLVRNVSYLGCNLLL